MRIPMSSKKPENLVISDKGIAAYEEWLKRLKENCGRIADDGSNLFSLTTCRLLAEGACVNERKCATCPAAKETLIWAGDKMRADGILPTATQFGPEYNQYPGRGKINRSDALNVRPYHAIHLEVDDGLYKEAGRQGEVTISVTS